MCTLSLAALRLDVAYPRSPDRVYAFALHHHTTIFNFTVAVFFEATNVAEFVDVFFVLAASVFVFFEGSSRDFSRRRVREFILNH